MNVKKAIGKKCWVIPDGYIPLIIEYNKNNRSGYLSHECACILNAGSADAAITLTIYFEKDEPIVIDDIVVDAERCWHLRMDELTRDGKPVIERGVPYGLVVTSTEPIVVQMSRLDTTQSSMAFLSTMGHGVDE